MPAQIVNIFRLPFRKVPPECGLPGSLTAIADGPSSQEYDLNEVRRCSRSVMCYGRIAQSIRPDYYVLADTGFAEVLDNTSNTRVLISLDSMYGAAGGEELWKQLPQERGHSYEWAPRDCAHHPILNANALKASNVFLLGYDGYFQNNGRPRLVPHAEQLIDTSIISRQGNAERPQSIRNANCWLTDVNKLSWDLAIRATLAQTPNAPNVYNLSLGSRFRPIWNVHPFVREQPFGRIDRRGPALIVHILENEDEIPGLGLVPTVARARWGALTVEDHAAFINNLRSIEPTLAIYVRTYSSAYALAQILDDDIQVGALEVTMDAWLHSEVHHLRLPPIYRT